MFYIFTLYKRESILCHPSSVWFCQVSVYLCVTELEIKSACVIIPYLTCSSLYSYFALNFSILAFCSRHSHSSLLLPENWSLCELILRSMSLTRITQRKKILWIFQFNDRLCIVLQNKKDERKLLVFVFLWWEKPYLLPDF